MKKQSRQYRKDERYFAALGSGTLLRRFRRKFLKEYYRRADIWDRITSEANIKTIAAYDLTLGGETFRLNLVRPSSATTDTTYELSHYVPPIFGIKKY